MRAGATTLKKRRRGVVAVAIALGVLAVVAVAGVIAYPRLGAWMIRDRAGARLGARLGRDVRLGKIEVAFGHAVLHDVDIHGALDGDTSLVHVDRVDVDFDGWRSLIGSVRIAAVTLDGVVARVQRGADGRDNVRDLVDRLRGTAPPGGADDAGAAESSGLARPARIDVHHLRVVANDDLTGTTALVGDGDVAWTPAGIAAQLREVSATTVAAPRATATTVDITRAAGEAPVVHVAGGELALWPKLALSGISGQIVQNPDPAHTGTWLIDVAGGYGGVAQQLWTAKGVIDPVAVAASVDLEAAKFQLDRLAPILEHSAVVDYAQTSVDTRVHVELDRAGARFAGGFHLHGLNVGHPMIADKEVHDLELSGDVAGSFDRATRRLELTRGDFSSRNVAFSITGVIAAPPHAAEDDATLGPHGLRTASLHLVIPTIDCQRVLEAIPSDMAPYLAGYRLRGVFDADIHADVDWTNLDATVLDGHVGIDHCRVVDEPSDSPKRLKDEFEHYVEVEQGQWVSFQVGPSNSDFVPLDEISPYLVKSIMTTEDSGFYFHHGFIPSEFRTALVNDLKAGGFRFGASSITMQMVKNVLLYREKTLARKLQELFLTWHVEHELTKDRIMEIYLNVIEYGPGLYGIGPASWHFFSKPAKDLNPVEAAFFSTILPAPKERYKQYCEGTLTKWTSAKIERILKIELSRDRLTQAEFDGAMATPLVFAKDDSESEDDCLKRVQEAIKKARPTAPPDPSTLVPVKPAPPASPPGRHKHTGH